MYCFDNLQSDGPISYQCDVGGKIAHQHYIWHGNGIVRHSSGLCLGMDAHLKLVGMDCNSDSITRWERTDEYQPDDIRLYEAGVQKHGLTEDLPDH